MRGKQTRSLQTSFPDERQSEKPVLRLGRAKETAAAEKSKNQVRKVAGLPKQAGNPDSAPY